MTLQDPTPSGRRRFFRDLMNLAARPLADYLDKRMSGHRPRRSVLRPPGALPEREFLETCYRCGACVDACPAEAIRPLVHATAELAGTPYIDPDLSPCTVCAEIACTQACPSGALRPLAAVAAIEIGLAEVYQPLCRRTTGEACTACVDACPMGEAALRLCGTTTPEVVPGGCVGCGVCQHACPTTPKAIIVQPR